MAVRRDNKIEAASWERIKELVATALELEGPERVLFLSHLADEEPSTANQVVRLVSSHERAGTFLEQPLLLLPDFLEELEPEQRFSEGDVLCGRFRIVRLIGKGGMGEVYEAWDQELEEAIALKTLRFEISGNEIFTARFRREVQLARKVTHRNVCRIFDNFRHQVGNEAPVAVLSMELLRGETLSDHLKKKGRLTTQEALPLVQQIVAGLQAVHDAGIIHRDLKPSNLVLVPEDDGFCVKLTDFGIAGRLSTDPALTALTQGGKAPGTPDYMAPEQLEHGRTSVQSDIYSLGLILYEILTGKKPFDTSWNRLYHQPRNVRDVEPDVNRSWEYAITRSLAKNPHDRPHDLAGVMGLLGDPAPLKWPKKSLLAIAIGLLIVLAALWVRPKKTNPDAQFALDTARAAIANLSREGFDKAIEEYKRATVIDPRSAEGWAELAYAYAAASNARYIDGPTALNEARKAALRSIQLDPTLAKAQGALGWTQSLDFDEWPNAETAFRKALQSSPDDGQIHYWFGVHLRKKGRFKEAEEQDMLALKLTHQRDPNIWCELAFLYWTSGQTSKLQKHMLEQLEIFPNFPLTRFLNARLLKLRGNFRQAQEELAFAQKLGLNPSTVLVEQISLDVYQGNAVKARRNIERLVAESNHTEVDGLLLAGDYAALHDYDSAFDVLEDAYRKKDNTLLSLATSPVMDPLRQDPRYVSLLKRLHFTDQIMQQIGFN